MMNTIQKAGELERLFRVTERWQDYLDLLSQKVERLDDETLTRPILFQIAETYERGTQRPQWCGDRV